MKLNKMIYVRWLLSVILIYLVFTEITGTWTRIWIVLMSLAVEIQALLENKRAGNLK